MKVRGLLYHTTDDINREVRLVVPVVEVVRFVAVAVEVRFVTVALLAVAVEVRFLPVAVVVALVALWMGMMGQGMKAVAKGMRW